MAHKTSSIWLKKVKVDRRMVKLVKWLNKFPSVYTLYCCEGDRDKSANVLFTTQTQEDMLKVIKGLNKLIGPRWYSFDINIFHGHLRYNLMLAQDQLEVINKKLK